MEDQSAFGWQTRMLSADMSNYVVATTTDSNEAGPTRPGAINGGFYAKMPDRPMQYPSVVIAVDDVKRAAQKVVAAGGKMLGDPMEIPGVGQYAGFVDSEGNRVSMLQSLPRTRSAPKQGE